MMNIWKKENTKCVQRIVKFMWTECWTMSRSIIFFAYYFFLLCAIQFSSIILNRTFISQYAPFDSRAKPHLIGIEIGVAVAHICLCVCAYYIAFWDGETITKEATVREKCNSKPWNRCIFPSFKILAFQQNLLFLLHRRIVQCSRYKNTKTINDSLLLKQIRSFNFEKTESNLCRVFFSRVSHKISDGMLNAKGIISIAIEICTIHLYLLYIVLKQIAGKEEERERDKPTNSNWEMVERKKR